MWADKIHLVNGYGPAECCVDAIVQPHVTVNSDPKNIGRGVAVVPWILTSRETKALAPIGAVGELVLEGPILARGYLNDPERTATAFIEYPDWLSRLRNGQSGHLYCTGDLVQYSPQRDGSLCYIGRRDNQIKLRGQRLELGEVEQHLRDCLPSAQEIVVDVTTPLDAGTQPVLAAFVVEKTTAESKASLPDHSFWIHASDTFREHLRSANALLRSRVPNYMIPTLVLPLRSMPLTPSGKVDRRRLKEESAKLHRTALRALTEPTASDDGPFSPVEMALQSSVATVLKIPVTQVGMQDNFVQIGGDSISAIKLVTVLRDSGWEISGVEALACPSLREMGHILRPHAADDSSAHLPPFSLLPDCSRVRIFDTAADQCHIDGSCIEDIYPVTRMQEALLALSLKQPNSYIAELAFSIPQGTDMDQLRGAWEAVFRANPILRTRVIQYDCTLYQTVIHEPFEWHQDAQPLEVCLGGALARMSVSNLGQASLLHLSIHHALYDGVSLPLLLQQVEAAYKGATLTLRPFAPFVAYTARLDHTASQKFWESEFEDLNTTTFPSRIGLTAASSRKHTSLTSKLTGSWFSDFTMPTMIHLAFSVLLSHYSLSEDVIYGLTLSGRNAAIKDIEQVTGPTITTIPFRVRLSAGCTIRRSLETIQRHLADLVPFEQTGLHKIRSFNEDTRSACDFQSHLIIQPVSIDSQTVQASLIQELPSERDAYSRFTSCPFVLICDVDSDHRQVDMVCNFDTSWVTPDQSLAFLHQLDYVLQQLSQNPDQLLSDIETLSPHDWDRVEMQNAIIPSRRHQLLHEMVFEQCHSHPEKMAVESWDGTFSYRDLHINAIHYAHVVHEVLPEHSRVVAICMEKSRWTIVAILAVLLTGSACVVMDPGHPKERIHSLLRQTSASVVLVSPVTHTMVGSFGCSSSHLVMVPASSPTTPSLSNPTTLQKPSPRDPAFIFFTSGSTGKPKAILLEHAALATGIRDLHYPMRLDQTSKVLHFASYAFDASILEIFASLASGICLCIPADAERDSNLSDFVGRHQIDWVMLTPSATILLQPDIVQCLKTLVLVGEPIPTTVYEQWAARLCLINAYGPAECTFAVAAGQLPAAGWVPGTIGPVVNGIGWVTSPSQPSKLAAWGAIGELLVEGPILAVGYMDDAEKTAAAFIPSPPWLSRLRGTEETRLYRTGDLVRYTDQGMIQFIGRRDRQVKLSGQRIELGELESHLIQSFPPGTMVAVEVVRPETPSMVARPRLFAFVCLGFNGKPICGDGHQEVLGTADEEFGGMARASMAQLSARLPPYMVPMFYVPLNYMPVTPTGKLDRRLLHELATTIEANGMITTSNVNSGSRAPESMMEILLANLWAKLLDLPFHIIQTGDGFFHRGGDSVMAMKLSSEAHQRGLKLTVADIFAHPILSDMATVVRYTSHESRTGKKTRPFELLPTETRDAVLSTAVQQCSLGLLQIEDIYPCTALQAGLAALSMRQPGAFIGSFTYTLAVDIDISRFRSAWHAVLQANSILRTRIIQAESLLQVAVCEEVTWSIVEDIGEYIASKTAEGFSLGQPLLHLAHTKPIPGQNIEFALVIYHALYDGWSIQMILSQVEQAYEGNSLPKSSFRSFIEQIANADSTRTRDYWISQLQNFNGYIFPSLPETGFEPILHSTVRQTAPVKSIPGITTASVIQMAWALTLADYTGSDDTVYGLTVSGRDVDIPDIGVITGPTIATVPFRFCAKRDEKVIDELRRLQAQTANMHCHEHFGLQNIRQLGDDASGACDFQNLLLIQPSGTTAPPSQTLWNQPEQPREPEKFSSYALELTCELSAAHVSITVDFDPRVVTPEQASRMASHFAHKIEQIQSGPESKISCLSTLSPEAYREIMELNASLPDAADQCVHDAIVQQCLETPDAPAVCAWDGQFTYDDLNRLSDCVAAHLRARGVNPESLVPICSEKTRWVAIAMLGVIKAGGAILLLDPKVPEERLRTIMRAAKVTLLISSPKCLSLAEGLAPTVVTIGPVQIPGMNGDRVLCASAVTPRNALYAIFTSGSTGNPKGVIIEHAAFLTSGRAQCRPLYLDSKSRTLQFASHMFDVSIADYLWTFLVGGCVCIASQDALQNDLAGAVNQFGVNRIDMTPSLARVMHPDSMPTLKTVLLGGESMSQDDIKQWTGKVRLVNGYGPAEASVCCILADVDANSDPRRIGHTYGAVPWVVDPNDHDRLLPIGAPGELVLEGPSLARGYLNDTEKTEAVFLKSPQWLQPLRAGSRVYKTGDLVQYDNDGTIRYLGRKDTQVKIRGQRVELGEIEHQIRESMKVDVVVEMVRPAYGKSGPVLVAFIQYRQAEERDAVTRQLLADSNIWPFDIADAHHRLRTQETTKVLKKRLPSYMVPTIFIPLVQMPISASGKSDRRLLRRQAAALSRKEFESYQIWKGNARPPETPAEHALQKIIAEVLGLEDSSEFGFDDDFFSIGGDSILAIKLVSQASKAGFAFAVTDVFRTPKLADLARLTAFTDMAPESATISPSQYLGFRDREDMIENIWSSRQGLCRKGQIDEIYPVPEPVERVLHQPPEYWCVNFEGFVDYDKLQQACTALVERHGILRTVAASFQGRFVHIVLNHIDTRIHNHGIRATVGTFGIELRRSEKLSLPTVEYPVTQFAFSCDNEGKSVLVVRLSHAQFDGYSLGILWHDLKSLYEGSRLPEPGNMSEHIQHWMRSQRSEAFEFWEKVLHGTEVSRIDNGTFGHRNQPPADRRNRGIVSAVRYTKVGKALPRSITQATLAKSAWALLLRQLTGQDCVVFAQTVNGRSRASTGHSEAVGMCLNHIPVRISFKSTWSGLDLMHILQEQHRDSLDHELVDWRQIIEKCTAWPSGTTHQSNVLHQNIDPDVPFGFGEAQALVTCEYDWPHPPDEILVETLPVDKEGGLRVTIDAWDEILDQSSVDKAVVMYSDLLVMLSTNPDMRLSDP